LEKDEAEKPEGEAPPVSQRRGAERRREAGTQKDTRINVQTN